MLHVYETERSMFNLISLLLLGKNNPVGQMCDVLTIHPIFIFMLYIKFSVQLYCSSWLNMSMFIFLGKNWRMLVEQSLHVPPDNNRYMWLGHTGSHSNQVTDSDVKRAVHTCLFTGMWVQYSAVCPCCVSMSPHPISCFLHLSLLTWVSPPHLSTCTSLTFQQTCFHSCHIDEITGNCVCITHVITTV